MEPRVAGEYTRDVRQEHKKIRVHQSCRDGREVVVVTDHDFGHAHCVVLVHDRDDSAIEQRREGVSDGDVAATIRETIVGEQELRDVATSVPEDCFPHAHEPGLPHRRRGLTVPYRLGRCVESEHAKAGRNRTARNDDDFGVRRVGDRGRHSGERVGAQLAAARREGATPQLQDDALRLVPRGCVVPVRRPVPRLGPHSPNRNIMHTRRIYIRPSRAEGPR